MKKVLLALSAFAFSLQAFAYDFSAADALFEQRAGDRAKIAQARGAYNASLSQSLTVDERVYAVEQMSRLSYYEALLLDEDTETIKSVTQECYDKTSAIAPNTNGVGETPQYYYWRSVCLSLWAKANGIVASLGRSKEVVSLFEQAIAVDSTYDGGGAYRLGAAVYHKLPAINPVGPRGDLNKAADYINKALASPAYAGAADPATATGDYFFNVYEYQAEVVAKQGDKARAVAILTSAIDRINSGDLPMGREPETAEHLKDLVKLREELK